MNQIRKINKELIATKFINEDGRKIYGMFNIINKNKKVLDIVERRIIFNENYGYIKYKNSYVIIKD